MDRLFLFRAALLATALTLPLTALPQPESASAAVPNSSPVFELDGLTATKQRPFDEFLQADSLELADYTAIHLAPATAEFRRNWQRDQNRYEVGRVKDSDVQRIREEMAESLVEILTRALGETGFALVDAPGPGVLMATPRIVKLDIIAPDVRSTGSRFNYSDSAGEMTLQLYLADGVSGEPLLFLSDRRKDPREEIFEWRTRPYNKAIAERLMRRWAEDVAKLLERDPT